MYISLSLLLYPRISVSLCQYITLSLSVCISLHLCIPLYSSIFLLPSSLSLSYSSFAQYLSLHLSLHLSLSLSIPSCFSLTTSPSVYFRSMFVHCTCSLSSRQSVADWCLFFFLFGSGQPPRGLGQGALGIWRLRDFHTMVSETPDLPRILNLSVFSALCSESPEFANPVRHRSPDLHKSVSKAGGPKLRAPLGLAPPWGLFREGCVSRLFPSPECGTPGVLKARSFKIGGLGSRGFELGRCSPSPQRSLRSRFRRESRESFLDIGFQIFGLSEARVWKIRILKGRIRRDRGP